MSEYHGDPIHDLLEVSRLLEAASCGAPEGGTLSGTLGGWSETVRSAAEELEKNRLLARHWPHNDYSWVDEVLRQELPEGWQFRHESTDYGCTLAVVIETSLRPARFVIILRAEMLHGCFVWCDINRLPLPEREVGIRKAVRWMVSRVDEVPGCPTKT